MATIVSVLIWWFCALVLTFQLVGGSSYDYITCSTYYVSGFRGQLTQCDTCNDVGCSASLGSTCRTQVSSAFPSTLLCSSCDALVTPSCPAGNRKFVVSSSGSGVTTQTVYSCQQCVPGTASPGSSVALGPCPSCAPEFIHQQVALCENLAKTLRKLVFARFSRMVILKRLRENLAKTL